MNKEDDDELLILWEGIYTLHQKVIFNICL